MVHSSGDAARLLSSQPLLARRFELVKVLGFGGAAAVFHVRDSERGGEEVALKVLADSGAFDARTLSRFEAEAALLQQVRHPHIVQALDYLSLGHTVAYTMELVRGRELSRFIRPGALTLYQIDTIFRQILSALHELHNRGVYHRDLKLENVLYSEESGVKLADFGLMKIKRFSHDTEAGLLLGTAQYLPPEYIRSSRYDARSDLYCVGLLLYELLSGARWLAEFSGNDSISYLVEKNFDVPHPLPSTVPSKYHRIIKKALIADVRRRYQSAYEMMNAFADEEGERRYGSVRGARTASMGRGSQPAFVFDHPIAFVIASLFLVLSAVLVLLAER